MAEWVDRRQVQLNYRGWAAHGGDHVVLSWPPEPRDGGTVSRLLEGAQFIPADPPTRCPRR